MRKSKTMGGKRLLAGIVSAMMSLGLAVTAFPADVKAAADEEGYEQGYEEANVAVSSRSIMYNYTYDADSYEDGFIAITTPVYSEDNVEIPDEEFIFETVSDEELAKLEELGIHAMDDRIVEAGFPEGSYGAFFDYDGAWADSDSFGFKIGTISPVDYESITAELCVVPPYENWCFLENAVIDETAPDEGEYVFWLRDAFHQEEDFTLYMHDELKGSGAQELEKTLDKNETMLACVTFALFVDTKNGTVPVKNADIELIKCFDIETFVPFDDYHWYSMDDYKKGEVLENSFSSAGIGTKVSGSGTYMLVGVTNSNDIAKTTISSISAKAYTGKEIKPTITVKDGSKTLKAGTDYEVTYANNKNVGKATVTITGKGDYSGSVTKTFLIKKAVLQYRAYVQKKNWMSWQKAGTIASENSGMAGTEDNLRMETIQMKLSGVTGKIDYRAYVEKKGWTQWASTADTATYAGTKGESKRVEMIQLKASGQVATLYDMYYCAFSEKFGWLGWASNNEKAGSAGYARKLCAFKVKFVPKGTKFDKGTKKCFYDKSKDGNQ